MAVHCVQMCGWECGDVQEVTDATIRETARYCKLIRWGTSLIIINHTFLSQFDLISGKPSTIATLPLMYQVFRNPQQIPHRSFAAKLSYFCARISAGKQLFRNQKIDTQGRTKPTTSTPSSSVRSRSLPPGTLLPTELAPAVKTCCRIFARVSKPRPM